MRTTQDRVRTTRVVLLDPIDNEALAALRSRYEVDVRIGLSPARVPAAVRDADAVILRSGVALDGPALAGAHRLRVIARAGSGTDNIDLRAARAAGVQVFNVPGGSSNAVAELVFGLLLALARNVARADRFLREGQWRKAELGGWELRGRTMGVVGLGAIGSRVAELAQGFGMRTIATVRRTDPRRRDHEAARGVTLTPLPELLAAADVVCLAVPLDEDSRGLIAAAELARMKRTAVLVNVSRGGVVDEDDLVAALTDGTIAGAALDVFQAEGGATKLAALDNVVLTPHLGGMSLDAQRAIGRLVVDNLRIALDGGDAANRVC